MIDPITAMQLAAWRAEEMQREAARFRLATACGVPRWRRVAGRALLHAGFRMMGAGTAPALVHAAEPTDC